MMPLRQSLEPSHEVASPSFTMARRFSTPDQLLLLDRGRIGVLEIGEAEVARAVFEPGWHWAPGRRVRGEQPVVGYVLGGRLSLRTASGRAFDVIAGDVFHTSLTREFDARVVGYRPAEVLYISGTRSLIGSLRG